MAKIAKIGRMSATLDFKNPIMVIVGHWNIAILNEPGWIANHLLGYPEGQDIELQAIVAGNQVAQGQFSAEKQIWLFDQFGMSCNGQRLELFARDIGNTQPLYDLILRISEKLPHTPIMGIGVNFSFQVAGDITTVAPLLETNEALESFGMIRAMERTDSLEIVNDGLIDIPDLGRPQVSLNIARKTNFNTVDISFNYHLSLLNMDSLSKWSKVDSVSHWKQHATGLMRDCYGFENVETTYF